MIVTSFAPAGFDGYLVQVEVDLRRGIPGVDIVGLPDSAVREARDRIRVGIRNSGFEFPRERVLVNLAPGDVPKRGSHYDLPIAVGVLAAAGYVTVPFHDPVLIVGEMELSGGIRPVRGVLSAVAAGARAAVKHFVVPNENVREAAALKCGVVRGASSLREAVTSLKSGLRSGPTGGTAAGAGGHVFPAAPRRSDTDAYLDADRDAGDFADVRGNDFVKRALMAAVAGRHHVLLFGPPGSGKTMVASRIPSIMPALTHEKALEVTRIHSIAGVLDRESGIVDRPPFRAPHHTASNEGLVGGGPAVLPGEISLAHRGVLFLDETPEFRKSIIQSLREPIESGRVNIVRAGARYWFPSDFQLVMAANPCSCGNLGRDDGICICGRLDVRKHWKRLGGPLLDRIDVRLPMRPVPTDVLLGRSGLPSAEMKERVIRAVEIQSRRYKAEPFDRNGAVPAGKLTIHCRMTGELSDALVLAARRLALSSRACHSVLRVARSLSDLDGSADILKRHLLEAVEMRRYGDSDYFWSPS